MAVSLGVSARLKKNRTDFHFHESVVRLSKYTQDLRSDAVGPINRADKSYRVNRPLEFCRQNARLKNHLQNLSRPSPGTARLGRWGGGGGRGWGLGLGLSTLCRHNFEHNSEA